MDYHTHPNLFPPPSPPPPPSFPAAPAERRLSLPPVPIRLLQGHRASVTSIAWAVPTRRLASADASSSQVLLWDPAAAGSRTSSSSSSSSAEVAACHLPPDAQATVLQWSPDGSLLACGTEMGPVCVFGADGKLKATLEGHKQAVLVLQVCWMGLTS
jgi:WD40 repeat protein